MTREDPRDLKADAVRRMRCTDVVELPGVGARALGRLLIAAGRLACGCTPGAACDGGTPTLAARFNRAFRTAERHARSGP